MVNIMVLIHLIGSVGMGIYLILPVLVGRLGGMSGEAQLGFVGVIYTLNRIAQFMLIAQLITGGYLMSKNDYSTTWMIVMGVVFLLIGATAGMLGGPMKRIMKSAQAGGKASEADLGKIRLFSTLTFVFFVAMIVIMRYRFSI